MGVSLRSWERRDVVPVSAMLFSLSLETLTRWSVCECGGFFSIQFWFGGVDFIFTDREEVEAIAFAESIGLDLAPLLERIECARYRLIQSDGDV